MQELARALTKIGLTSTEAEIYLSGLSNTPSTVQEISRATKIKRPTVYHAINTLLEKGLVAEQKTGSKTRYLSSTPDHLRSVLGRQKEELEDRSEQLEALIPLLLERNAPTLNDSIRMTHYTGIEGMKMVMDIAFHCRSRKWDIVAPYNNFLREYDEDYAKRYLNARKYYGITARTLWEKGARTRRELTAQEIRERNPRLMPAVMHGKFSSMMILFDDKIALFSSYDKLAAVLITSRELHSMFQALFNGIWEASTPYT